MSSSVDLEQEALIVGKYYLLDIDRVLEIYKAAGYDVESDDTDVPTTLDVGGRSCFFTGDFVRRGDRYYEIVIAAQDFAWEEVESESDDDDNQDDDA